MEQIDIVIPWVDDQDPLWREALRIYSGQFEEEACCFEKYYRDWETLLFVFRGIEKYMPWVGKIHFLTYGHLPKWLNTAHEKVNVVNHLDFFIRKETFPVFNSLAIEMNLPGIKGLSERFIYFNDDTLVLREAPPERFFVDGRPVDCLIQDIPRGGFLYRKFRTNDTYANIVLNAVHPLNAVYPKRELLKKHPELFYHPTYPMADRWRNALFNLSPSYTWIRPNHIPQPFLRSALMECHALFPALVEETARSKFRRYSDVSQYIYRYLTLVKGNFHPHYYDDAFCMVLSSYDRFVKELPQMDRRTFVCVNDSQFLPPEDYKRIKPLLLKKMSNLLPDRSAYEK
ncbi:MAG: Stealth CR1 domain-containing protein [Tannerellaceae bacterium]|jgi:hypothetical protein|nr:Stealth CR1 domain-containing protein [Tannerellaceae bacterium]